MVLEHGFLSGNLTHTTTGITQYDFEMFSTQFYGDDCEVIWLTSSGIALDSTSTMSTTVSIRGAQ